MSGADLEYRLIESAPRDRTLIEVMDPEGGAFPMFWNPQGFNTFFSVAPGIWETPDGALTWTEDQGHGPSYWRPLNYERFGMKRSDYPDGKG